MATKTIKAWIDGAVQEIEVEVMTSPEQPLSYDERLDILEDKPIIADGNFLVGNGTEEMEEITPDEVLEHINGASVETMTTAEFEALEETNANTLYMLTDGEEETIEVPTKVSELENDAGYLTSYTETDPTVPAWAKAETKPTYEWSDLGETSDGEINPLPEKYLPKIQHIIDVTSLPTENINESVWYRVVTGTWLFNQFAQNGWTCYCVDELPEVGEPATTDMTTITSYYNAADGVCYGYADANLSSALGVSVGWYPVDALLSAAGYAYGGVVTSMEEAAASDTFYLLLEYVLHSYKGGWNALKIIGKAGTGASAEVFNHPSNSASGGASHAEGSYSHAEGYSSHAEGYYSHAEGYSSHAEGYSSHAEGDHSHAEGYGSHAEGNCSHAEGNCSHAEGHGSHAKGNCSHAEGSYSHAEGCYSHAERDYSHAEGYGSHAKGNCSHAEGNCSHAEGNYSHAEGSGSLVTRQITGEANATIYTIDSTYNLIIGTSVRYTVYVNNVPTYNTAKLVSIDEANSTITLNRTLSAYTALTNQSVNIYVAGMALSNNSHSEGNQTIAAGRSQHTQGEYNIVDPEYDVTDNNARGKYAHIVGNGTSHTARSNAHTLDWDGNAWFAGDVYVGGASQDDTTAERLAKVSELPSLDGYATEIYTASAVSNHNTSTSAHNDIRLLIEGLTTRLNALADSDDTTLDQMSEIVAYIKSNKTLIEDVTTNKVNVSDIIDNLTTNVTNKPLSAAQGVALKALIDALDSDKLDSSALTTAVEDALAQAKASGEFDGADGEDGAAGKDGEDGVGISSVEQTTTSTADDGNNIITVTLTNGNTSTFTVQNGSKGSTGETGATGADGYTPVRGTDYWTDEDKAEIKAYVDEAILGGAW